MHPVRFNSALIRSGKFGSERYGPGHVVGSLSGEPLSCGEKKVERGTEGWRGQGRCQQRQHRDEGPGLETKIIKPRSGSFRKPLKKKDTREISTVGLRRVEKKKKKKRAVSLFVWTATAEK